MKNYDKMTDKQKTDIINQLYCNEGKSFKDIADTYGTYANKVRRDAVKLNIKIRNKSEAQKNALTTGKHKHPTKGTTRSQETKEKIGHGVLVSWDNISKEDLEDRKNKAKLNWDKLDEDKKKDIIKSANVAVRKTSKEGSKLEKFILNQLLQDNYRVVFHEEQTLSNTKLQIDISIPSMGVAIEVDGPSHFQPVWGEDALNKNIKYDQKKEGLILGKGFVLIRIQQTKDYSNSRASLIYKKLKSLLEDISSNNTTDKKFVILDQ